jgi:hypothetical protein
LSFSGRKTSSKLWLDMLHRGSVETCWIELN